MAYKLYQVVRCDFEKGSKCEGHPVNSGDILRSTLNVACPHLRPNATARTVNRRLVVVALIRTPHWCVGRMLQGESCGTARSVVSM